jgi:hypothetical protein
MDHTLPRTHTTLSNVDRAMESIDVAVRGMDATARALNATFFGETLPKIHTTLASGDRSIQNINVVAEALNTTLFIEILPNVHTTLLSVDRAMQSIDDAARSIKATAGIMKSILFIIALAVVISCYICASRSRKIHVRKLNRYYLCLHYGDDINTTTETYVSLIKCLPGRVYERTVSTGVDETKVVLVGANEEVESCIRDRTRDDGKLYELLFVGHRFIFRSIAEAMGAVDEFAV